MNKLHQISTKFAQIVPLLLTEQRQIKGGMASMDEEKTAKARKSKV
jgi:hypothetical protein